MSHEIESTKDHLKDNFLIKTFETKLDELDESNDGIIKGYAAVFNNVDYAIDRMLPKSFKKSIERNQKIPILDTHNLKIPIGINNYATEDKKGLKVEGKLFLELEDAKKAYQRIKVYKKNNFKMGLSIGGRIVKGNWNSDEMCYDISEFNLMEYSVVMLPANSKARIQTIKGFNFLDALVQKIDNLDDLASQVKSICERKNLDIKEFAYKLQNIQGSKPSFNYEKISEALKKLGV